MKLETLAKDFEDVKNKVIVVDYGINKVANVVREYKKVLKSHEEGILELDDRLLALEKKEEGKQKKDFMYG